MLTNELCLQAFVQQDPLQASSILNLLIMDSNNSDILAPLFQPNLCPEQFVRMYESTTELAEKHGPTVAFAVLTKVITCGIVSVCVDPLPDMEEQKEW